MKLNHTAADFSRMTTQELIEFQRHTAMLLWRLAPTRPTKAARLLTLRRAQCLAGLARALEADPNLRERRGHRDGAGARRRPGSRPGQELERKRDPDTDLIAPQSKQFIPCSHYGNTLCAVVRGKRSNSGY
jgi:hypothetical protein